MRVVFVLALAASLPVGWWKSPALSHRILWRRSPGFASQVYDEAWLLRWRLEARRMATDYAPVIASWLHRTQRSDELTHRAASAAWRASTAPAKPAVSEAQVVDPLPHFVVVTIDALRADVAAGGTHWPRLAARGLSFSRAYAPASSTVRSLPTMVSGRYDWRDQSDNVLESLLSAGYRTALVTHQFVVDYLRYREQVWLANVGTVAGIDLPRSAPASAPMLLRAKEIWREREAAPLPLLSAMRYWPREFGLADRDAT
jgi:hypothetical protein